jgi:hypothetical protein
VSVGQQSLQRQERSAVFFARNRRGGNVILHHRRIRPVLVRDWSPTMDGITATIWASQTTLAPGWPDQRRGLAARPPAPETKKQPPEGKPTTAPL